MTAPPVLSHNLLATASGRRQAKAARKDVYLQCSTCGVTGTGRLNPFGRMTSVNLPTARGDLTKHRDCGGTLRAFDIGGTDG